LILPFSGQSHAAGFVAGFCAQMPVCEVSPRCAADSFTGLKRFPEANTKKLKPGVGPTFEKKNHTKY
jgi:hypothetical protein